MRRTATRRAAGLRARLLLAFLLPPLVTLTAGGFLLARASRGALEDELGQALSAIAATISAQLRTERLLALTPEDGKGEGSRTYRSLVLEVQRARQASGVRRVVVVDRERLALLDVGGSQPLRTEVPELLRDSLELERVFAGERAASQVLFQALDGQFFKTGYAPLFLDDKVVGAVAVEGTASFFRPLSQLVETIWVLVLVTLLVLAMSAVLSARVLSRPLERLVAAALRIGRGDLSTPVRAEPTLEIGILARELEAMRTAVDGRDRQVKLMLGGVAHEVRNPLGGIELFRGLLEEELRGAAPNLDDARAHLERIRVELDYLKRIVEDFLGYAREQKLGREPFDARALVDGACARLAGEAAARGLTLAVDAASMPLLGDQNLLTSALVNVVKNAVQASAAGAGVKVTGRAERGAYVVTVEDAGPGITEEVQRHIFEPFFTTREKGTGLGLALARKLVEAHGGSISVASRPGATCFTFTLPC